MKKSQLLKRKWLEMIFLAATIVICYSPIANAMQSGPPSNCVVTVQLKDREGNVVATHQVNPSEFKILNPDSSTPIACFEGKACRLMKNFRPEETLSREEAELIFRKTIPDNTHEHFEYVRQGSNTQNCHSTVCQVKGVVGIDESIWVNHFPYSLILKSKFEEISLAEVEELDVIAFLDEDGRIIHSGTLAESPPGAIEGGIPGLDLEGLWVQSKFGRGGIYKTTPTLVHTFYNKTVQGDLSVKFYRSKDVID